MIVTENIAKVHEYKMSPQRTQKKSWYSTRSLTYVRDDTT